MADELEDFLHHWFRGREGGADYTDAAAIAAAIRERFVLLDKHDCKNCIGHTHIENAGRGKPMVYDDDKWDGSHVPGLAEGRQQIVEMDLPPELPELPEKRERCCLACGARFWATDEEWNLHPCAAAIRRLLE